jgi:hypothetical protein
MMSDVNWARVRQGEAQMILGGQRPILSLTIGNVRDAAGDDSLSDEFCAEVLNRYKDEQDLPWVADVAALVEKEKKERARPGCCTFTDTCSKCMTMRMGRKDA